MAQKISQKEKWEIIKASFLEQIEELDDGTCWTGDKEPKWWLEMMAIARELSRDETTTNQNVMKTYSFYWKDGTVDTKEGKNVAEAFTKLGYGAGAVAALDYTEEEIS